MAFWISMSKSEADEGELTLLLTIADHHLVCLTVWDLP